MAALTLAAALTICVTSAAAWPQPPRHRASCGNRPVPALCKVHWWVRSTWRRQDARHMARTRYWYTAERNPADSPWISRRQAWRARSQRIAAIPIAPWPPAWLSDALCVHHYEGPWNDPDAPYWGGMQMDRPFMEAWGHRFYLRWGTADRWPPIDQLLTSYRAWRVRGWEPWPQTARACHLIP